MTITLAASAVTSTGVTLTASNPGANGTIEFQIGLRSNFSFCIAPILTGFGFTAGQANSFSFTGLNQAARYFARARTRLSSGAAEAWSNVVGFYTPLSAPQQGQTSSPIVMQPALVVLPEPILSIAGSTNASGAAGEISGYPATNLLIDSPVSWRALASNGQFALTINTAGAPIDTTALLRTNLPEAAQWNAAAALTQAGLSSPAYTSGALQSFRASANLPGRSGGYHGLLRFAAPQAYPWWQINIRAQSGGPPGGFLTADHLIMGLSRVSKTVSIGMTEQGASLGSLDRNRSGVAARQDGYQIRHVEFDISYETETQYQLLHRELHYRTNDPLLIMPNAISDGFLHDRMLYGTLGAGKSQLASSIHQTKTFVIDSLI